MSLPKTIDQLLNGACPSIQYGIRAAILGERPPSAKTMERQERILEEKRVLKAMRLQQATGWLGTELHGTDQLEGCIRLFVTKAWSRISR